MHGPLHEAGDMQSQDAFFCKRGEKDILGFH
jgi:hypothetical protein